MNRIKNLRWIFLAAILIVGGQLRCQNVISISPLLYPLPDSVVLGTSFGDSLYVINNNDSGAIFSGTITIETSVNDHYDSAFAGISFDGIDSFSLSSHDSLKAGVHVHFISPYFSAGPSVVVIWPIATPYSGSANAITGDTLTTDTIQILYPAAITGPLPAGLKVYTCNEQLFIKCEEPNELGYVRIFDVTGALIREQDLSATNSIPMSRFSDGIYLAELTLTNGQQITYKIFSGR